MKKMRIGKKTCLIAVGLSTASTDQATGALDPTSILSYRVGALQLRPNISLSETYNDNVYYEEVDKDADFITVLSPGVNLILGHENFDYIALSYQFGRHWYWNESEISANSHSAALQGHFEGAKLTYDGSVTVSQVTSPLSGALIRTTSNQNRELLTIGVNQRLLYDLGQKTDVYGAVGYDQRDYESGTTVLDVERMEGTVGFGYKYSPKTRFFGEVYYGQSETSPNLSVPEGPSRDFVGGFIGAEGDFTAKTTGTIKAGYESSSYSDGSDAPSGAVASLSIKHNFSIKNSLDFTYTRAIRASDQQANSAYETDGVNVNFVQMLGNSGKLFASIGAGYEYRNYEEFSGRTDNLFNAGFSLVYQINLWMSSSFNYNFTKIDSNYNGVIDYAVNRVTVSLSVGF